MTTMGMPITEKAAAAQAWGLHLHVDLYECNPHRISDEPTIRRFVEELVDRVGMKAFGELFLKRFALDNPDAVGYTAIQAIETSDITAHFAEGDDSAYIDLFSCKPFDAIDAARFIAGYFGSDDYDVMVLHRGARRRRLRVVG